MLKKISVLIVILYCNAFSQTNIETKVIESVVYPHNAMITREGNVNLNKGIHKIIIPDLTDNLIDESIRINSQEMDIIDLRIERKFTNDERLENARIIQAKIDSIKLIIKILNGKKDVLISKENFIESLKSNSADLINKNMISNFQSTKNWNEILNFIQENLIEINSKKIDIESKIEKFNEEISLIEKQKNDFKNNRVFSFKNIIIDIEVEKSGNIPFQISYIVENANWYPLYDAKFKDESDSTKISFMGMVQQSTGEDWNDVKITLVNSSPTVKKDIPKLYNWVIESKSNNNNKSKRNNNIQRNSDFNLHYSDNYAMEENKGSVSGYVVDIQTGAPLIGANVILVGSKIGAATDVSGKFMIQNIDAGSQKIKASYLGYQTKSLSFDIFSRKNAEVILELPDEEVQVGTVEIVASSPGLSTNNKDANKWKMQETFSKIKTRDLYTQFILDKKYTVPSDNNPHKILVKEFLLPTTLKRISIPKIDESVFIKAKSINTMDFPLLSGNVNIYLNNEFINSGGLELTNPSDTLNIALGIDNSIKISRVLKNKILDKSGLFSSTDKLELSFEYYISNMKNSDTPITIVDHLPIAINKDIKVTILEPNLLYEDLKYSKEVEMNLLIKSKENKIVPFSFRIEYPDDIVIYGIDKY